MASFFNFGNTNANTNNTTLNTNANTAPSFNTTSSFNTLSNTNLNTNTPAQPPTQPAQPTIQAPKEDKDNKKNKEESKAKEPASLKQILERSKLTNSKILSKTLPSIDRGLTQLDSQSKKISAQTATSGESVDIRAHYFLAQGGVNTQVLIKGLGTVHLGGFEEERQPIQDTNIEDYLEQERTETIMKIVQDERQEILDDTNDLYKKDIDNYWNDLLNNRLDIEKITETNFNISKEKLDNSRVINAAKFF